MASKDSVVASGSPPEPLEGSWIVFMPPLTEPELDRLWAQLCRYEPNTVKPTGPICGVLRRVQKYRPNDFGPDEFLHTILSETCIRFKKYYNSSFKPPMDRWLYMQAWSAALDFVKHWVPGYRYNTEDQPTGFVDFDDVHDRVDTQSPQCFLFAQFWPGELRHPFDPEFFDHLRNCESCWEAFCRLRSKLFNFENSVFWSECVSSDLIHLFKLLGIRNTVIACLNDELNWMDASLACFGHPEVHPDAGKTWQAKVQNKIAANTSHRPPTEQTIKAVLEQRRYVSRNLRFLTQGRQPRRVRRRSFPAQYCRSLWAMLQAQLDGRTPIPWWEREHLFQTSS
jgi:hypothetical protein